jgi:TPR repeat protein
MNTELARLMALANAGHHAEVEVWARPRAERGDPDGQFLLGFLPCAGACTDAASAREWLHRAAAQDHPEALYALSRTDDSDPRWHSRTPINDTMRARMRRAAQLGSADAQHDLGTLLSSGHGGFPKDEAEARGWQERAARAGHLQALVSIGRMCLRGEGGPSDPVEGLAWLEKAAATEISSDPWAPSVVSDAARLLKAVYARGMLGVTPDPTKAAAADARLLAAGAVRERARVADDCAVGLDAEGQRVTRPFAFANPDEARRVLAEHLAAQRRRGRAALLADLNRNVVARLRGSSGLEYEASVYVFWSDQPDGELSVSGSIKDLGWLSYKTLSEFFSVAPDGTVGD